MTIFNYPRAARLLSVAVILGLLPTCTFAQPTLPRERIAFDANWLFHKGDFPDAKPLGGGYALTRWRWKAGNESSSLTANTAGGDWKDAGPADDVFEKRSGFAWFRITLPPGDPTKAKPVLHFSGVDDNATVYMNGQKLAYHEGWNKPFDVDLQRAWKSDRSNELAVLVENVANTGGIGEVGVRIGPSVYASATNNTFPDADWRKLDLPHDWGIEGSFGAGLSGETGKLPWMGVGWYRKHFNISQNEKGRRFLLEMDGAMSYAQVWLNGKLLGGWPYGYASWALDLTPAVRFGTDNVLAIRLDNPPESSRWYPGGGIYRDVWLTETNPVHVGHWGTQVTCNTGTTQTQVNSTITLQNEATSSVTVRIVNTIIDANSHPVSKSETMLILPGGSSQKVKAKLMVANAKKWSLETPYRYTLITQILQGSKVLDRYETPFGIRTMQWTADKGFLLNGVHVRLNGVCLHHDLGALGSAWNKRAAQRQLEILRGCGVNAIRTSHNPPAPGFLDLCDQMGFLVLDEFTDMWQAAKKPNGYSQLFDEWAEKDLRAMMQRDRNHPCVIAWSIGNEIPEQEMDGGQKIERMLVDIVHQEDSTRPATSANDRVAAGYNGWQKNEDVFGYNYKPWEYAKFRAANPNIPIFGSETASTISSRGEYLFPVSDDKEGGHLDLQMSSYDLYAPGAANQAEREFRGLDENPFVAGEFVWTGFDYLGEPTPFFNTQARSSYFGIVDLAGFPKDRYYLYQAHWRPDFPMAHILPHWNWPERVGQVTPVHVYTSGDEAELFLNGKSLGRKKVEPFNYRIRWDDVIYEPGTLHVVAYKNGKVWAQETVKTTGVPAKVAMLADRSHIANDGKDLSFITVEIADSAGDMVPRSMNDLKFSVTGPGEIVATDNGDATDLTSFQSKERKAFNGLALVIVKAKQGQSGKIVVKAESEGLIGSTVTLSAGQ